MLNKTTRLLGLVALGVLTGCGGGGGGGADAPPAESTATVVSRLQASGAMLSDSSTSVAGTDANANGVRDDVDAWIAAQKFSATQASSVNQLAKSYQRVLTLEETNTDDKLRATRLASSDAVECVMQKAAPDIDLGYKIVANLRRVTVNTDARVTAYLKYVELVNDTVARAPEGDGCEPV